MELAGYIIGNRWKVISEDNHYDNHPFLTSGAVYVQEEGTGVLAYCTGMLTDSTDPSSVEDFQRFKIIACIVKELSMLGLSSIPAFIEFRKWKEGDHQCVCFCTEPVGPTLWRMSVHLPAAAQRRFSLFTCLHIALETLYGIKDVHNAGYLIRSIAPNVIRTCTDPSSSGRLMFDCVNFWMARRWLKLDDTGPFPYRPRNRVGFRGTVRYSSINAMLCKDLTRLDDLWSWFYVVFELTNGSLPWMPQTNNKQKCLLAKQSWHQRPSEWLGKSPEEYLEIFNQLQSSGDEPQDEPDYDRLAQLIKRAMRRVVQDAGIEPKLDWEPGGQYYDVLGPLMTIEP